MTVSWKHCWKFSAARWCCGSHCRLKLRPTLRVVSGRAYICVNIKKTCLSLIVAPAVSLFVSVSHYICLYITHCVPLYVFVSLSLTEPRPLTLSEKAVSRHLGDPVGQEVMRGRTYLCSSAVFCPEWPRPPPPTVTTWSRRRWAEPGTCSRPRWNLTSPLFCLYTEMITTTSQISLC